MYRGFAKVNGINIFYRDTSENKPVMLCLHGRWGRGETWTDLISRYENSFRIIAPDQRGHGLSDRPESAYSGNDFAEDAFQLLRSLNCRDVIIIGHSLGGRNGALLAADHPEIVRALVIIDSKASGPDNLPAIKPEDIPLRDELTKDWPVPYRSLAEARSNLSEHLKNPNAVEYFMQSLAEKPEGYDFLFGRKAMSAAVAYYTGWFDKLKQIACPVLLMRAAESWHLSRSVAQRMVKTLKNCTYAEISGSDHMIYADNPAGFYRELDSFL